MEQPISRATISTVEMSEEWRALRGPIAGEALTTYSIVTSDGADFGDVEDVLIESASGRVTHLVVSYGDWLNSRSVAVPWQALRLDAQGDRFILDSATAEGLVGAATDDGER
jgi:sporulation protein YlmC with PRC-barrel domain